MHAMIMVDLQPSMLPVSMHCNGTLITLRGVPHCGGGMQAWVQTDSIKPATSLCTDALMRSCAPTYRQLCPMIQGQALVPTPSRSSKHALRLCM